ncbi:hypothetical protein [Paenibacillus sp. FSL L8-0709]|uniref:hypothetical protein n=2 Tax=unclassified Paenibacillus TaxID=185978 RepID=UPI0030F74751
MNGRREISGVFLFNNYKEVDQSMEILILQVFLPIICGGVTASVVMAVKNGGFVKPSVEKVGDVAGNKKVTKTVFVAGWLIDFFAGGIAAVLAVNSLSVFGPVTSSEEIGLDTNALALSSVMISKVIVASIGAGVAPIAYLKKFALGNQEEKDAIDTKIDDLKNRRNK